MVSYKCPDHPANTGAHSLTPAHAEALLEYLDDWAEIVILDLGSQVSPTVRQFLRRCDRVVLVSEAVETFLDLTQMLLNRQQGEEALGTRSKAIMQVVVVNRMRMTEALTRAEIEKVLAQKLLAFIPPAPKLFDLAARERRPAILTQPKGPYASALRELVEALA